MVWTSRSSGCLLGVSFLVGCAARPYEPTSVSSADGAGYAVAYVDQLRSARTRFDDDDKRATELHGAIKTHADAVTPNLKLPEERAIVLRVVEESEQSGRGQSYAHARANEQAMRGMWDDERGAIGARVTSSVQKEALDAGCKEVDLQPAVQHALRDGFDKQLERRARASNEGQRTLEQNKARLPAASFAALQRLSDEIALASHLGNVALVDDLRELERLLAEQKQVDDTLARMIDDERQIQRDPKKPSEQKASQERVMQIDKQRAALAPEVQKTESELRALEDRQHAASIEYERTLSAVRESLRQPVLAAHADKK